MWDDIDDDETSEARDARFHRQDAEFRRCVLNRIYQEYGLYTNADLQLHVSPFDQLIYSFQPHEMRAEIAMRKPPMVFRERHAGYLLPLLGSACVQKIKYPEWAGWGEFHQRLSTTVKGRLALACVRDAFLNGRLPLWCQPHELIEVTDKVEQIKGTDLIVKPIRRIQVKADLPSAGTGNLYLQRGERNPDKQF